MIARFRDWYGALSRREQVLVGIMLGLLALVMLWLGVARPVDGGLRGAIARHGEALDRNAAVRAKVAALKALPPSRGAGTTALPVAQMVNESVAEAGFTLERNEEQAPGRTEIAIAAVRPQALFGWIAALEQQGIVVETINAQPAAATGTVSVQAVLKARGQ
ncbi:MAG: type II secretory protein PulM [Sphingobium sp.]|nr:MAG: type II secretory protein PulM [Sphingobium sp.]